MHIGFDAKRFFHNETGLGFYSRQMVRALAENGLSISLFDANPKPIDWLSDYPNISVVQPDKRQSFWRQYGIANDIRKSGVDLYHGLSAELPLSKLNCPKVVTIHDVIFEKYPRHYSRTDRMIYRQKTKWACKQADAVIAISERTAKDLSDLYSISSAKIKVIPPYTESTHKMDENIKKKHILCLSQFEERKNHLGLLRSYKRVAQIKEMPPLVLAGKKGKTLAAVMQYIKDEDLGQLVTVKLNIGEEEKKRLIAESIYAVYPSVYEGYGIPVVEAMNQDVPTVVAQNSSMEEIVGQSGFLFDPATPLSLDEVLLNMSEEALEARKQWIPSELERCSKPTVIGKHLELYSSLV